MSGKRLCIGFLVAAMLAVLIYVSHGMVDVRKGETYRFVAVILDNSSHDRWNAFKEGLEQGAEENRIRVNVVFTGAFRDPEEECAAIRRELENGAQGVIVQMAAQGDRELFEQAVGEAPVVLVENSLGPDERYPTVGADPLELGAAVAESVRSGEGESLDGRKIGILSGNQSMYSQEKCLEGFLGAMEESGAEIAWTWSEEEWNRSDPAERLRKAREADAVVALDNGATECAITFLQENSGVSWPIYGEGHSEKAIYYLDKGLVRALVVPSGFSMGYRSAELMAQELRLRPADGQDGQTDFFAVTRDNLYDKDVEKILFPIVS